MKKLLLSVFISLGVSLSAQSHFIAKVVNQDNQSPVFMAKVSLGEELVYTDKDGVFLFFYQNEQDEIIIEHPDYQTCTMLIGEIKGGVIALKKKLAIDTDDLEEENDVFRSELTMVSAPPIVQGQKGTRTRLIRSKNHTMLSSQMPIHSYNEEYGHVKEAGFMLVDRNPLSTFSIDVDVASYSRVRKFLNNGSLPDRQAVRVEEMINYFNYDYREPAKNDIVGFEGELGTCPWDKDHKLLRIAVKAKDINKSDLPPSNFVFLVDVSGSMNAHDKLPLLQAALRLFVREMRPEDRMALVTYAGSTRVVLESCPGKERERILKAINALSAGGSTAGASGLELAYAQALEGFISKGNNRILLATDGDFNVGPSTVESLIDLVKSHRDKGVFMSVLGFGTGNLKDNRMEAIADNGNGNYAYIDNILEASKVLVKEYSSTLFTVAKDVKLQIEFNPHYVSAYRLIGYENRTLQEVDFNNDKKDAGELGAGQTVTALYEIVPKGAKALVDPLRYQKQKDFGNGFEKEWALVKLRYKRPNEMQSVYSEYPVLPSESDHMSDDFMFASAVSGFGMLLKNSELVGDDDYAKVANRALATKGQDLDGYRAEFIRLVEMAGLLSQK